MVLTETTQATLYLPVNGSCHWSGGRGSVDFYRNPNTQADFNERGPWGCGGQATYIVNGTAVGMPGDSIIAGGGAHGGGNRGYR